MKVLLVNPPVASVAAKISTPPLGLCYLTASLKAAGHDALILDADALDLTTAAAADEVKRHSPDVLGVTAMTPTVEAAWDLIRAARGHAPKVILGGPHVSAVEAKVFEEAAGLIDAAVLGEGEETLPRLLNSMAAGRDEPIPGVLRPGRDDPPERPRVRDLNALPFPERASLPAGVYRHPLFGDDPVTAMITSRGCPYRCVFCDKRVCGATFRPRTPENVLAEIEEIALNQGVRRIIIYDDLFTLDRNRVISICKGIIDRGLNITWKCEGRVNRTDAETLSWMRRAGCELIAYGVETAKPSGLEFLRKDITPEQARDAFRLTREAGIRTLGYFLLGIPGETMEDELKTVRFAVEIGADYAQFGILSPLPGTPLYDLAAEKGWLHEAPARGPAERGSRRPVILDGYWTIERLDEIARRAHRMFYFRPGYLARRVLRAGSWAEVKAGARQAAKLLGWMAGPSKK